MGVHSIKAKPAFQLVSGNLNHLGPNSNRRGVAPISFAVFLVNFGVRIRKVHVANVTGQTWSGNICCLLLKQFPNSKRFSGTPRLCVAAALGVGNVAIENFW
jgi:hypothetical protein